MKEFLKILSFMVFTAFLVLVVIESHDFGLPVKTKMDDYFINNAQKESATNNVVTAVVFDYRGLDTLFEATVLFAAVTGISLLFSRRKNKYTWKNYDNK